MSATKTSVVQAAVAFLLLCLLSVDGLLGLGATAACVLAFPPVRWGGAQLRSVLVSYAVWLLVWAAFAVGYLRLMSALGRPVEPQAQLLGLVERGVDTPGFYLQLLLIVAIGPVIEEVVFRGYLFTALQRAAPKWVTHAVVASVFGLVHGVDHAVPIGVLSLLFGYLRERHDGLLPSVLAHALHNGATITVFVLCPDLFDLFYAR